MPEKMEVSAKVPAKDGKPEKSAVVYVTTGKDAEEMIKMFGQEAVKTNADANWKVTLQAAIRRALENGKTQEQIQQALADAKMGVKTSTGKVDPIQASLAAFASMTKEDQKAYLEQLKAAAANK